MKTTIRAIGAMLTMALLAPPATTQTDRQSQAFKLHNIFGSNMAFPTDKSDIIEGFSVADEDGKFYMAHTRYEPWGKDET